MNIFSTAILGITAFCLFSGALWGFIRGAVRSAVRFGTVFVAFLIAWICKKTYVAAVFELEIEGSSIGAVLTEALSDVGTLSGIIIPLIESLLGVILFIVVFLVLKAVSAFLFFIIRIFLPKGNRKIGALIGLLQGALIAFAVCAPLNGLICNFGQLFNIEISDETIMPSEAKEVMKEVGIDFDGYRDSSISKLYTSVGNGFYVNLASGETEYGEYISFPGAVESFDAFMRFVNVFLSIGDIDTSDGYTLEYRNAMLSKLRKLDSIRDSMSDSSRDTFNTFLSVLVFDTSEEPIVPKETAEIFKHFDIETVCFEEEGEAYLNIIDYFENADESDVTATELVNSLAKSTLILNIFESSIEPEDAPPIPEDKKAEFTAAIDQLEDEEAAETIRKIFGLQ